MQRISSAAVRGRHILAFTAMAINARVKINVARRLLLAAALALQCAVGNEVAQAQNGHWPAELHAALASTGIPRESVALYVHEVGASGALLEWNADRAMNPA